VDQDRHCPDAIIVIFAAASFAIALVKREEAVSGEENGGGENEGARMGGEREWGGRQREKGGRVENPAIGTQEETATREGKEGAAGSPAPPRPPLIWKHAHAPCWALLSREFWQELGVQSLFPALMQQRVIF